MNVSDFLFLVDLNRDLFVVRLVESDTDACICALADLLTDKILLLEFSCFVRLCSRRLLVIVMIAGGS